MSWNETDKKYMQRALALAAKGAGFVAPNPMVGCVIVHNNQIIGEGWHQIYGEAHAEVMAIDSVADKSLLSEALVYVSLEPCAHYGKTPPCADLLITHKVKKVIICNIDPYDEVAGRGIRKLKEAGIEVAQGLLEAEGERVNRRFFTYIQKNRPYIILKWAQSADGYIAAAANGPTKISSEQSTKLVHKWRAEEAAILVGTNTALADNPQLSNREWPGKNPTRIVLDRYLRLPATLKVFDGSIPSLWYNVLDNEQGDNLSKVKLDDNEDFIKQVFYDMYERKLQSVLVEGGAQILETLLRLKLWDEARLIVAPMKLESGVRAPYFNLADQAYESLAEDRIYTIFA